MKILALAILCLAPVAGESSELVNAKLLSPLKDDGGINGCSWSASAPNIGKGFIFLAEYDQSKVRMNLNGRDTELQMVSSHGYLKDLGSVMTAVYRSESGAVVYGTFRTTWLCPKDGTDESCEVTKFNATFEATTGTRRQVVHAKGDVGC